MQWRWMVAGWVACRHPSAPEVTIVRPAEAPRPVTSGDAPPAPVCTFARAPRQAPPPAVQTLEGLARLVRSPDLSIADVERDFGTARPSSEVSHGYEITAPLTGIARVLVHAKHVQNREYLDHVRIELDDRHPPTVGTLARQLGLENQLSHASVRNGCMDAICASVSFDVGHDDHVTFLLPSSALGAQALAPISVTGVELSPPCTTSVAAREQTPLLAPVAGPEQALGDAILAAARELLRVPYDPKRIQTLLAPVGQVTLDSNDTTHFAWVRLFPNPVEPFCFPGFTFVQNRDLLCAVWDDDSFLYELEGNATHRLFMKVDVEGAEPPAHISSIELPLMPRGWKDVVF